jgi:uncharacterized membrane protein YhaH (DUF805 family)
MNIIRQDRLLIPLELVCCAAFLWAMEQGRRVHHRSSALWLALLAAGPFVGSMFVQEHCPEYVLSADVLFWERQSH